MIIQLLLRHSHECSQCITLRKNIHYFQYEIIKCVQKADTNGLERLIIYSIAKHQEPTLNNSWIFTSWFTRLPFQYLAIWFDFIIVLNILFRTHNTYCLFTLRCYLSSYKPQMYINDLYNQVSCACIAASTSAAVGSLGNFTTIKGHGLLCAR